MSAHTTTNTMSSQIQNSVAPFMLYHDCFPLKYIKDHVQRLIVEYNADQLGCGDVPTDPGYIMKLVREFPDDELPDEDALDTDQDNTANIAPFRKYFDCYDDKYVKDHYERLMIEYRDDYINLMVADGIDVYLTFDQYYKNYNDNYIKQNHKRLTEEYAQIKFPDPDPNFYTTDELKMLT